MKEEHVIYMVATKVSPEKEKEFNDWYSNSHVPMVLKAPGMIRAKRFKLVGSAEDWGDGPTYIAIYDMEGESAIKKYEASPERAAVQRDGAEHRKAIGYTVLWKSYYKQILAREK